PGAGAARVRAPAARAGRDGRGGPERSRALALRRGTPRAAGSAAGRGVLGTEAEGSRALPVALAVSQAGDRTASRQGAGSHTAGDADVGDERSDTRVRDRRRGAPGGARAELARGARA